MPAYLLVKAIDGWNPDEPMVYNTGYPVSVSDRNQYLGDQTLPTFVQFVITDATPEEVQTYCREWERIIDYEYVSHDWPNDAHQIRVFTRRDIVSASGLNAITRQQVENFLNEWGMTVSGIAPNEVIFDATVFNAIKSNGFWGRDVSQGSFTEKAYDQGTGDHRVEVNYSSIPGATQSNVSEFIAHRGCILNNINPVKATFTCNRELILEAFKSEVKDRVYGHFSRRMWYFSQAAINAAITAGGSIEVTRQQALNYLHDRLLD